jgi:elongation factor P
MDHLTPGNLGGIIQTKLRRFTDGKTVPMRLSPYDKLEEVVLEKHDVEFLYSDTAHAVFMNTENYEQIELPLDLIEEQLGYLLPNTSCVIEFFDGQAVALELPTTVALEVTDAPPAERGNTATNVSKEVITETGLKVKTPHYVQTGDKIKVDTRNGDFVERVK